MSACSNSDSVKCLGDLESDFVKAISEGGCQSGKSLIKISCSFLETIDHYCLQSTESFGTISDAISLECERSILGIFEKSASLAPPGDIRLLDALLILMQKLQSKVTLLIVFEILPRIVSMTFNESDEHGDDEIAEKVVTSLEAILHRADSDPVRMMVPVLECLSSLQLNGEAKRKSIELLLSSIPALLNQDLPKCVQALLNKISEPSEALAGWTALRHEISVRQKLKYPGCTYEEMMKKLLPVVFCAFSSVSHRLLATTYIQILESKNTEEVQDRLDLYVPLDIIVLLILVTDDEYKESTEKLFYSWLSYGNFPFDILTRCVGLISAKQSSQLSKLREIPEISNRLFKSLIQVALFLLMTPARIKSSIEAKQSIEAFAFVLYEGLVTSDRIELIRGILYLAENSSPYVGCEWKSSNENVGENDFKRKRGVSWLDAKKCIHQSAISILRKVAENNPPDLAPFKPTFIRLLHVPDLVPHTDSHNSDLNDKSVQGLCCILSSIVEKGVIGDNVNAATRPRRNELLDLLQQMLFSSTCRFSNPSMCSINHSRIHGLMLAIEIISSHTYQQDEKETIRDWVLQLALPKTRQMVVPEVGRLCLNFLLIWQDQNAHINDVFEHIKLIMSDTGLMQKKTAGNNDPDSVRSNVIASSTLSSPGKLLDGSNFVFCIDFYVSHCRYVDYPSRWSNAVQWIFGLVDTYLTRGQRKCKTWKPERWLNASFEFPNIDISGHKPRKLHAALRWLQVHVCTLDSVVSKDENDEVSGVVDILANLNLPQLRALRSTLVRFRLSLLLAGTISAALVKNGFSYFCANTTEKNADVLLDLIKWRLAKIYDSNARGLLLDSILSSLVYTVRRRKRKFKSRNETDDLEMHPNNSVLEGAPSRERSKEYDLFITSLTRDLRHVRRINISSGRFVETAVLWHVLMDHEDRAKIFGYIECIEQTNMPKIRENFASISQLVHLRCNVLKHLTSLIVEPSIDLAIVGVDEGKLAFCLQETTKILDLIPKLLLDLLNVDSSVAEDFDAFGHSMNSLAVAFVRFLFTAFMKDQTSHHRADPSLGKTTCCIWPIDLDNPTAGGTNLKLDAHVFALFEAFAYRINKANGAIISDIILEMISMLAMKGSKDLIGRSIAISWKSMHTSVTTNEELDDSAHPFAFSETIHRITPHSCTTGADERCQDLIVKFRLMPQEQKNSELVFLRRNLLRHWGLVCATDTDNARLSKDFMLCAADLETVLELFGIHKDRQNNENLSGRKRKNSDVPSIVGLNEFSFSYLFDWMMQLLCLTCEIVAPAYVPNCSESLLGPYNHLEKIFRVFRRLAHLYISYFPFFPKTATSMVWSSSKEMLRSVVGLLHRCVDWRSAHPMAQVDETSESEVDLGSFTFLQNLIESMSLLVVKPVFSICDKWQEYGTQNRSGGASLRNAAEKTEIVFSKVAALHNFTRISFEDAESDTRNHATSCHLFEESGNFEDDVTQTTKTLDQAKDSLDPGIVASNCGSDDDDDSFGIQGCGWGESTSN